MDPAKVAASFGIREGMRVTDFGSGAGDFVILAAQLVGDKGVATAVDVLDSALEVLRSRARAKGLRNVEVVRSNLEVLGSSGLANESQDMVLIINTLFQSNKKADMVTEARRVLKPGGSLIVIDWLRGVGELGPPDYLRSDQETIRQTVEVLGFRFGHSIDPDSFHFGMIFNKT